MVLEISKSTTSGYKFIRITQIYFEDFMEENTIFILVENILDYCIINETT